MSDDAFEKAASALAEKVIVCTVCGKEKHDSYAELRDCLRAVKARG